MDTQHTPGPWAISKSATPDYAPQFLIHPEESEDIAIVKGDNAHADALLIAAAPALLAACQFALDSGDDLEAERRIRAAIALAQA